MHSNIVHVHDVAWRLGLAIKPRPRSVMELAVSGLHRKAGSGSFPSPIAHLLLEDETDLILDALSGPTKGPPPGKALWTPEAFQVFNLFEEDKGETGMDMDMNVDMDMVT